MNMVLNRDTHIDAQKRTAQTTVIQVAVANSQALDNEAVRANGLYRKIRRARITNLDASVVRVQFCTQDAAGANDVAIPYSVPVGEFQTVILEPEEGKVLAQFLSTLLARRFSAFLQALMGAIVGGVEVNIDYWDDITL
jgi:hypothetical protein